MTFTSPVFFFYIAGVWVLHAITPGRYKWVTLLAASVAFYCISDLRAAIWLLLCTCLTFFGAKLLQKQQSRVLKKVTLAVILLSVFGLLSVFKFAGFAANILPSLFGRFNAGLLLPLGISFYIFQSAGYVIDIYRDKYTPETNIAKYALFVSFFPQIVQGPIGRYDRLAPQLLSGDKPDADAYRHGIQLVLWGLFKKMILADRVGILVNTVFSAPEVHGGIVTAVAAAFYCIQIYCDFSGGIDISRGVAEGLGIKLDSNFRQPLFAISVSDYWRRWHITLGSWMRDYLFYPISLSRIFGKYGKLMRNVFGNRVGRLIPSLTATFIVFFVIGIWHGGAYKFIIFGIWNGLLITAAMLAEPYFEKLRNAMGIKDGSKLFHAFRIFRTLLIIGVGRILTRAANTMGAVIMLKNIFTSPKSSHVINGALLELGLNVNDYIVIFAAFIVLLIADIMEENDIRVRDFIARRAPVLQILFMIATLLVLTFYGAYGSNYVATQFLYAAF